MQELAEACGEPLALTSANKSGGQSTLFAEVKDHNLAFLVIIKRELFVNSVT